MDHYGIGKYYYAGDREELRRALGRFMILRQEDLEAMGNRTRAIVGMYTFQHAAEELVKFVSSLPSKSR